MEIEECTIEQIAEELLRRPMAFFLACREFGQGDKWAGEAYGNSIPFARLVAEYIKAVDRKE
jgi:hypothetical protein